MLEETNVILRCFIVLNYFYVWHAWDTKCNIMYDQSIIIDKVFIMVIYIKWLRVSILQFHDTPRCTYVHRNQFFIMFLCIKKRKVLLSVKPFIVFPVKQPSHQTADIYYTKEIFYITQIMKRNPFKKYNSLTILYQQ